MGATLGVTLGVTNSKDNRPDSQQVKCWVCWVSLTVCRYVGAQWRLSNMSHNRTMRHARQSIWSGQIYNWTGQIYKTSGQIYKMWTNRKNLLPPAVRALAVRRIMSTFATKSGEARQRLSRSASRRVTLARRFVHHALLGRGGVAGAAERGGIKQIPNINIHLKQNNYEKDSELDDGRHPDLRCKCVYIVYK